MKIHYGIYDTHLNEWVTNPLELTQVQVMEARRSVVRMNRAHDLLPDEFKLAHWQGNRYKLLAKVML